MLRKDKEIITIIGKGSSISFTNGAPIVTVLDTRTIIFVAVVLYLNGKILSSWNAVWYTAVNPTYIDKDIIANATGTEISTNNSSSFGSEYFIYFC